MAPHISIVGIRGVPAQHGGFETFAEKLALYLVNKGWNVTVYCQETQPDKNTSIYETWWNGVRRVHISVRRDNALGTVIFDWRSLLHCRGGRGPVLMLGYNTAVFGVVLCLPGRRRLLINMDGIEWRRSKWSLLAKAWLFVNEFCASVLGNVLIADHPAIEDHLKSRLPLMLGKKIVMIPYGSDRIDCAQLALVEQLHLTPKKYIVSVARIEPENNILEIVQGFSSRERGIKLVILGRFSPNDNQYHREIANLSSDEVIFAGAIYEKPVVEALRKYAWAYVHGHSVGGTNPSLVEALGAGNAVLAHDNVFNRWVTNDEQIYFKNSVDFDQCLTTLLQGGIDLNKLEQFAAKRHSLSFRWETILSEYEALLRSH